jgi:hypothetical protein
MYTVDGFVISLVTCGAESCNLSFSPRRQLVVTFTAIPPRFSNLPRKLASIARQDVRPDRVELHLPKIYRRFPGATPSLPSLPEWVDVIYCEDDLGPATKVLPAAARWRGTDTDLLLCDDDRIQDRGWVSRFVTARRERPRDIIAERGWNIDEQLGTVRLSPDRPRAVLDPKRGRSPAYRLKRILSFGLMHPPRAVYASSGYADVFEGFLGALVPAGSFPDEAWTIPDVVWTVDDVWLSGMAYRNGYKVWVTAQPRPVFADGAFDRLESLTTHVELGIGRDGANRLAVEHLRDRFGAWP